MRKIIVHTEPIKRKAFKSQFQIKLPDTASCVTGILVTLTASVDPLIEPPAEDPASLNMGSLWLRIPEQRDVFYADFVKESNPLEQGFNGVDLPGIGEQKDFWFSGEVIDFFSVHVPVCDTLIEGYYLDESTKLNVNYRLKIYLELDMYE